MTYRQLYTLLQDAKIEDAEWDALCLMEHFCAASPSLLRSSPDRNYENTALEDAIRRRLAHARAVFRRSRPPAVRRTRWACTFQTDHGRCLPHHND